ncbi:MAG: TolC family protein [Nitrospiraceae bacterium]|nr:MAG: TolC family protein [Nitrospiraceae bacterium]
MRARLVPAALLLFGMALPAAAGTVLTLNEAIETALRENPAIRAHSWSVKSREEDLLSSQGTLFPALTVEEKYSRTNNPTYGFMAKLNQERFTQEDFLISSLNDPDDISDYETSFTIHQPLIVPTVYFGIGVSERELEAQEAEYERKKDETARAVVKAFLAVRTADEHRRVARKALEDAREHRRLASVRYESGTGLYSDLLRAEVAVKNAELMIIQTAGNAEVARRALGLAIGRTEPVEAAGEMPVLPFGDIQGYLEAAGQRDDVAALELRHEGSRRAVKLEKARFLPEAGLSGSYILHDHKDPFSPEGESYYFMGYLRWRLFDVSSYHMIRKAEAQAGEAAEHLSALKKSIHFRVNEAYTRVQENEKKRELSAAVLMEAEEALKLVRVRYENGLAPVVDLLDTQLILDAARAGVVEAENEHLNALAELYHESGMLLEAVGSQADKE